MRIWSGEGAGFRLVFGAVLVLELRVRVGLDAPIGRVSFGGAPRLELVVAEARVGRQNEDMDAVAVSPEGGSERPSRGIPVRCPVHCWPAAERGRSGGRVECVQAAGGA